MSGIPDSSSRDSSDFGATLKGFLAHEGLPFADILSSRRVEQVFRSYRNCFGGIYTTSTVLWAFLSQVLRDGKEASCRSAVARISSWWSLLGKGLIASDTGAYCRARAKLSEGALSELTRQVGNELHDAAPEASRWKRWNPKLVDGFTATMADTPANQAAYPQNPAQKPGIGFPIMRAVIITSLATATMLDMAFGPYKGKETGELSLFRSLLPGIEKGDLIVADRYYGSYFMIALLIKAGAEICFRKHQKRHSDFRKGKRLGKWDHLVQWERPPRPAWMSQELYDTIPETLELRETKYVIDEPGRRHEPFIVISTLKETTGENAVSYDDIAELYHFRWNSELDIRSIKTHLNLDHMRCKSPEMVRRELWVKLMAYNLIRTTAACAAALHDKLPRQISFVGTCQYVLSAWDIVRSLASPSQWTPRLMAYCRECLDAVATWIVGDRPGRFEPRVLKKRQKITSSWANPVCN